MVPIAPCASGFWLKRIGQDLLKFDYMATLRYSSRETWVMGCKAAASPHEIDFRQTSEHEECHLVSPKFPYFERLIGVWGQPAGHPADEHIKGWVEFRPKDGWYLVSRPNMEVNSYYLHTPRQDLWRADIEQPVETYLYRQQFLNRDHYASEVVHRLNSYPADAVFSPMIADPNPDCQVIDVDVLCWRNIKRAALESTWIPPEYYMNDWVSDVCSYLRKGFKSDNQDD